MTNGDKIRDMDDIELADFLEKTVAYCSVCPVGKKRGACKADEHCPEMLQNWLEETWTDS